MNKTIKEIFESTGKKPRVNCGTIGHIDHGKTTTAAAFAKVLNSAYGTGKKYSYADIDNAPEEKARGITINKKTISMETDKGVYLLTDCPGHADYVKNTIVGMNKADFLILVVSSEGASVQTKEHVLLAKETGVKNIFVYINKCDLNSDLVELVQDEIEDLLIQYGFLKSKDDPEKIIAHGSSLTVLEKPADDLEAQKYSQVILDFFQKIEKKIELERGEDEAPFLAYLDSIFSVQGRGTVVTAIVRQGTLKVGDKFIIEGYGKTFKEVTAVELQISNKKLDTVSPGDNMAILIKSSEIKSQEDLRRGMAMTAVPLKQYQKLQAVIYLTPKDEGGRKNGIVSGYSPQVYLNTGDYTVTVELTDGKEMAMPGDNVNVNLVFQGGGIPLDESAKNIFAAREGGKTVFSGVVTGYKE